MSDIIALSTPFTYSVDTISDTPIYNALAAAHHASRRPATHRAPSALSRSCVMSRSPMGGRHRRSTLHGEHALSQGRHHLVTADLS
jgi:hypothetical protein